LLTAALRGRFPSVEGRPAARAALLDDAGMVVVRARLGDEELWCRGDVGPHGFTSIAGHAHADALSFELRIDGVDVFADPGTYCYHGAPEWRRYFRGTVSHSTLELDGRDQSVSGGPFLWTRHANTRLLASSGLEDGPVARWAAEHDGYSRRRSRLLHRRTMELDRDGASLAIVDEIVGAGRHTVALRFQLGPTVEHELDGAIVRLGWRGHPCGATMRLDPRLDWQVHRGDDASPLGWYSPAFGERIPAATLVGRGVLGAGERLRCEIAFA
jgi:hypothetical protein